MKRLYLLILCLLLLLLSSCQLHIDTDPWPSSPDTPSVQVTKAPVDLTIDPSQQDTAPELMVTPTPLPFNDEVKPGLNG